MTPDESSPIVFFDGVCNLCNGFINFLFLIDRRGVYRVGALQGQTAHKILPAAKVSEINTIIVYRNGQILEKSDAVLTIAGDIGGVWGILRIFQILPRGLRDLVYDFVARHRFQIFGRRETCRVPTPDERARFLD